MPFLVVPLLQSGHESAQDDSSTAAAASAAVIRPDEAVLREETAHSQRLLDQASTVNVDPLTTDRAFYSWAVLSGGVMSHFGVTECTEQRLQWRSALAHWRQAAKPAAGLLLAKHGFGLVISLTERDARFVNATLALLRHHHASEVPVELTVSLGCGLGMIIYSIFRRSIYSSSLSTCRRFFSTYYS